MYAAGTRLPPMRARAGSLSAVVAIVVGLSIAGCGGSSDSEKAGNAVESYLAAIAQGEGTTACDLLSTTAQGEAVAAARSAGFAAATCEQAVKAMSAGLETRDRSLLRLATISDVTIDGDTAEARVEGGDAVTLEKTGDAWKISKLPASF